MSILKVNTIQDKGGNAIISSDGAGTLTLPSALTNQGFFEAYPSSDTNITTATWTKVTLNAETYDVDGWFDSSTNYRYTPQSAGKYLLYWCYNFAGSGTTYQLIMDIYKNGSSSRRCFSGEGMSNANPSNSGSTVLEANGTTDYFEWYIYHNKGSNQQFNSAVKLVRFGGYKLIGA